MGFSIERAEHVSSGDSMGCAITHFKYRIEAPNIHNFA